jgi:hypothetical protein
MNEIDFRTCCFGNEADLDLYLSRSLSGEQLTGRELHLAGCAPCRNQVAQRQAIRHRLRAAVDANAPAGLEYRIRHSVGGSPRSGWRTWLLIPVAAVALAAVLVPWSRQHGRLLFTAEERAGYIDSIGSSVSPLMQVGLQQHLHCTVFRRHDEKPATTEDLKRDLGPEYAELIPAIQQNLPRNFRIIEAHVCTFRSLQGRAYTHVAASDGTRLISLLITNRAAGQAFENDLRSPVIGSPVPVYAASVQRFSVAGFETRQHLVYVVSDLSKEQNMATMKAMAPAVARVVRQGEIG